MKKHPILVALLLAAGNLYAQAPIQFTTRSLVVISDADMSASAYVDGNLLKDKGTKDALTTITFPLNREGTGFNSSVVSNSSVLTDKALAVSNNGRLAFVLEGRAQTGDSLTKLTNGLAGLTASGKVFTVDLSQGKPAVKYGFTVGTTPSALTLNPQGTTLLVATADAGKEIKIIDVDGTGKPTRILTSASPATGQTITDLAFHPGGQFVAYVTSTGEVGMMKYVIDATSKKPYLEAQGKTIKVGTMPGSGKFSANGNYYVVADAKKALGAGGTGAGEVFVVQFSTEDKAAEHKIVAQVATGEAPEAVAISPDGSTVVVANSGQSYQPFTSAGAGKSSLSVYALGADGKLTPGTEVTVEGVMPQALEFDRTGDNLAVAVSEYLDYGNRNGGIEFYKVTKGATPALTKQPGRISVTRGAHALKAVN